MNSFTAVIFRPVNKFFAVICLSVLVTTYANSQDLPFVRQQIKMLTSPVFFGRGYIKNGDSKAVKYLSRQFRDFGLLPFGKDYFQTYGFEVNTFPGAVAVKIDGKSLVPGIDFIVNPGSGSCRGTFPVLKLDTSLFKTSFDPADLLQKDLKKTFVFLDTLGFGKSEKGRVVRDLFRNKLVPRGILYVADKSMIFSVRSTRLTECMLLVKRISISNTPSTVSLNIKSKLKVHEARNLIGYIPGETDTFIVFTAHYDHLGGMGRKTFFPGANDNASGTCMVLDFIRDLSSRNEKHKYGYTFMLFSGEEAGLLGSHHYADNPLFPLEKIKMVLNFDMVATGSEGITVFNGSNYPSEFQKLDSLNKALDLNLTLKSKGTARNSDHYSFQAKNVKALFFNTAGKEVGYHSVSDTYEALPFTVYERLYKLVATYVKNL